MSDATLEMWVEESFDAFFSQKYKILETIFSGVSPFQKIDVLKTAGYGTMLLIDGVVMLSERDEFIYHDMISHVPMFIHPNPKKVLIIGGGDGGTAREVLRHDKVEGVWMVEIDGMVVDVCKRYIPLTSESFNHPKLNLLIEDGVKFAAETDLRFDVIIVDSTDPIGHAKPLFGEAFYRSVSNILKPDGIVVAQGESCFLQTDEQRSIVKSMAANFPKVHLYNYSNLTYPGGLWSFAYASKGTCPLNDFDPKRVTDSPLKFKYYNSSIHKAAFALPQFQKEAHAEFLSEF